MRDRRVDAHPAPEDQEQQIASRCLRKAVKGYLLDNRRSGILSPDGSKTALESVKELEVLEGGAREAD